MNNYKILFSLRVLKSIVGTFLDSFLVLYFLDVSSSNILPLGIYKLVAVCTVYAIIFCTRNICKSKNRVYLMRIGIIFNFIYFLSIIILRENVVKYIYLIGFLYGLEEGFYYSIYNNLESSLIKNGERARFTGNYTATKSIFAVIMPLIFGGLINEAGFIEAITIMASIVVFEIVLSFLLKDDNIPKESKANLKEYKKIVKNSKKIRAVYNMKIFSGLTYSEGPFSYIVTIYIIKVFSNSVSLGIFTSIFSLISVIIGFSFARWISPRKHYENVMKISTICTIILLCLMIYKCNMLTIILFNLSQTFSKGLTDLINGNNESNTSNIEIIRNRYKEEYWIGIEKNLLIGRVIGNMLFILMAFTGADIMIYLFVVFLIMFEMQSIRLQKVVEGEVIE